MKNAKKKSKEEYRCKISFHQNEKHFTNRHLNMNAKLRTVKCCIISTLLYGSETWTPSAATGEKVGGHRDVDL